MFLKSLCEFSKSTLQKSKKFEKGDLELDLQTFTNKIGIATFSACSIVCTTYFLRSRLNAESFQNLAEEIDPSSQGEGPYFPTEYHLFMEEETGIINYEQITGNGSVAVGKLEKKVVNNNLVKYNRHTPRSFCSS